MRFLLRNAIFIIFPATMVAIIYLANMSFGTAVRFGEWGERSVAESMLIVNNEKIERFEEMIATTDDTLFGIVDPSKIETSCDRWRDAISVSQMVEAAAIIDEHGDIAAFFYLDVSPERAHELKDLVRNDVVPLLDKFESLDQYKHIHKEIGGEYRLITHYTTLFRGEDYTACLLFNNDEIVDGFLADLLKNVGEDRVANVVDDHNDIILGRRIDGTGQFIVYRRFPTTLYKWRLQLAPTASSLFNTKAKEQAQRFSSVLLIPLALGVIVLGLIVLYMAVVRERRLNRLRSDFIANVSHELRTPLSLIRMFGELLLMGKTTDRDKADRYAEVILRETDRLASLVDNVLDLAKIERGKGSYSFDTVDVKESVDRGVEVFRHRLSTMNIELLYSAEPDLPSVRADGHSLTLVVVNLIDNAIKYAKGTDVVGVEVSLEQGCVQIDVYDHGAGIPIGQLKRVFERFYRVPSAETKKQRGSGIGLNLVKNIADSHGGNVVVKSDPSTETRFSIRIPIENERHSKIPTI